MHRPRFDARRAWVRPCLLVLAFAIAASGHARADRYVDDALGYHLDVPEGWSLHRDPAGSGVEITFRDEATVVLLVDRIPPEHLGEFETSTPETWGRSAPGLLAADLDEVRVVQAYVTTLAGVRAVAVEVRGAQPGRRVPAVGRLVVAVHDGHIFFVVATMDAARADAHAAAIDAIIDSIALGH